jgi:hypothetical protein
MFPDLESGRFVCRGFAQVCMLPDLIKSHLLPVIRRARADFLLERQDYYAAQMPRRSTSVPVTCSKCGRSFHVSKEEKKKKKTKDDVKPECEACKVFAARMAVIEDPKVELKVFFPKAQAALKSAVDRVALFQVAFQPKGFRFNFEQPGVHECLHALSNLQRGARGRDAKEWNK